MNRHGIIEGGIGASALAAILVVILADPNAADAEPSCAPAAWVTGEHALVAAIEPMLRDRGITVVDARSTDPSFPPHCRLVAAEVMSGGGRVLVWITDPDGRRIERETEDPTAAATVIESWARRDLIDPLFTARSTIQVGAFEPGPANRAVEAPAHSRFTILAGAGGGLSGDGALWTGFHAQGCAAIGRVCLGGTLRYGIDLEQSGDTAALDNGRRTFDVTITVEVPVRRGRAMIAPMLGIGQSSVTAKRDLVDEEEFEQAGAFHARAGLAAGYRLAGEWSVRLDFTLDLAPFARQRLGEPDGVDRQLAASPLIHSWLGLGLAYGGM